MNTIVPDKHIRKEIYDRIHNLEINTILFKCFDTRVTRDDVKNYILLSTQLNQPNRTKCGRGWTNSTEIQVITIKQKNDGSRVLLDDAVNGIIAELEDFSLPNATGLKVNLQELSVDNEIVYTDKAEVVYTKILRLECDVN